MIDSATAILGIEVIVKCDAGCENGMVYDPCGFGWEDLNKLDNAAYEAAIHDRGFSLSDNLPPEEGPCIECDGTGEVRRRLTVAELWEALANE